MLSERERIFKQRKEVEAKLHRLARAYIDGFVTSHDYNVEKKLIKDALSALVIPEADASLDARQFLESLGFIWDKATLEERHKLLSVMLEAVYIDLAASRVIVGIQPKPPFILSLDHFKTEPGIK